MVDATIKTDNNIYLLLGEQAADCLTSNNNDLDTFFNEKLIKQFDYSLVKITDGMSLVQLLNFMDGYFGYAFINEEEYNAMYEHDDCAPLLNN